MKVRYGQSMYGGWYAEVLEYSQHPLGWHNFPHLYDLKQWAKLNGHELVERRDNI